MSNISIRESLAVQLDRQQSARKKSLKTWTSFQISTQLNFRVSVHRYLYELFF